MKMKKILSLGLIFMAGNLAAQNSYTNAEISSTSDLIGTARYVSMGGALGALGADISAIGSNPAAIGLYRKNDVALTAGVLWPKDKTYNLGDNLTHGTFDQLGFVTAFKVGGENIQFVNFAFNYQKKFNFNNAYFADCANTYGLSQADQLASISNNYYTEKNLQGTAWNAYCFDEDEIGYYNAYGAQANEYANYTTGSSQAYDMNISFNSKDRYYFGFTLGCENVRYSRWSTYTEFRDGNDDYPIMDYTLYNDQRIDGFGINLKAGTIIRPIEESSFRVGLAVETPTWYSLKSSCLHSIDSRFDEDGYYCDYYTNHPGYDDSYLEYRLRTPWRARFSMGSTVDKYLAWGAEYEYANYGKNNMYYTEDDNFGGSRRVHDNEMNALTKDFFTGQHTLKLGVEAKPADAWAFRLGYNFISSPYKDGAFLDSHIDSYAMDYMTSTSFMNLGATNILALGIGWKAKHFYADLTYKVRNQKGDFYAFDDSFSSEPTFVYDNPGVAYQKLDPTEVNLTRHQVSLTLGVRF